LCSPIPDTRIGKDNNCVLDSSWRESLAPFADARCTRLRGIEAILRDWWSSSLRT